MKNLQRFGIRLSIVVAVATFISQLATCQNTSGAAETSQVSSRQASIPITHLLLHFLLYQEHLDKYAVEHGLQVRDGGSDYLQTRLGFTDSQFAIIRESSLRVRPRIQNLSEQARSIALSDRKARNNNQISHTDTSPGREQLKHLSQQREDLLSEEMNHISSSLGPVKSSIFTYYLTHVLAKNVRIISVDRSKAQLRSSLITPEVRQAEVR